MISGFLGCCFPSNKNSVVELKDVKFQNSSFSHHKFPEEENVLCKQVIQLESEYLNTEDLSKNQKKLPSNTSYKKKIEEELVQNISSISNNQRVESLKADKMSKEDSNTKMLFSKNDDTPNLLNESDYVSVKGNKKSRFFSEQENSLYPNLKLNLILGDCFETQQLSINASGLVGSLRKALDGITFFGCKNIEQIDQILDYELNLHLGLNTSVSRLSLIFMIYFKKEIKKYFIRACKNSRELDDDLPSILVQIINPIVRQALFNYLVS